MYPNWLSLVQVSLVLAELLAAAPTAGSSGMSAVLTESKGAGIHAPESRLNPRPAPPEPLVAGRAEAEFESEAEAGTLQRRWTIDKRCPGDKRKIIRGVFDSTREVAERAAEDALSSNDAATARFHTYFGTDDITYHMQVYRRLSAVARHCNRDVGDPVIWCHDLYNQCNVDDKGGIELNAYTSTEDNAIILCPRFFKLHPMPTSKDRHDQATTLIHEMTHLSSVFSPNTVDYVFNPENVKNLEPQKALLNGETYNLYARAVWRNE